MKTALPSEKNLKLLSDESLDQSLLAFVKKEKEVLKEILCHIAEVDRRRLFLRMGYSSLYVYLTERMNYDGGSAQRRIDAARLVQQVPSVLESIDQGEITLAQVTFLQKSLRQVKDKQISLDSKTELLESMKRKTLAETQVEVCKTLDIPLKETPKISHQANESVRLEVTLTKEQWEKIKTMRELLSNTLPSGEGDQVLEYVAGKVIEQKMKGPSLKRQVLQRDGCCQYKDRKSGKMCGSKWNLQVDHIRPRWAGGSNELSNLRAVCANHNQELYRQQAGIRRITAMWQ